MVVVVVSSSSSSRSKSRPVAFLKNVKCRFVFRDRISVCPHSPSFPNIDITSLERLQEWISPHFLSFHNIDITSLERRQEWISPHFPSFHTIDITSLERLQEWVSLRCRRCRTSPLWGVPRYSSVIWHLTQGSNTPAAQSVCARWHGPLHWV